MSTLINNFDKIKYPGIIPSVSSIPTVIFIDQV